MRELRRSVLLTTILIVAGSCGIQGRQVDPGLGHSVRGVEPYARWVIDSAIAFSPTVQQLVAQLDAGDLIAYVQVIPIPSRTAHTAFMHGGTSRRYVLIRIHQGLTLRRLIELLGHELQHAVEIMRERDVHDEEGLRRLFRRIGLSPIRPDQFETRAAMSVERLVRQEITGKTAPLHARKPD